MTSEFKAPIYHEVVKARFQDVLAKKQQNQSIYQILVDLYVNGLPNKTEAQAKLIIDKIKATILQFNAEYQAASEDSGAWVDNKLDELAKGKTEAEQYALFMKLYVAVKATDAQMAEGNSPDEMQELLDRVNELESTLTVDDSAIENADLVEIREKLRESLLNSYAIIAGTAMMGELLEKANIEGKNVADLTQGLFTEVEYEMLLAMLCYIACKDGSVKDVPSGLTIEMVTIGVCAQVVADKTVHDAAEHNDGLIDERIVNVLKVIACVTWTLGAIITIALPVAAFVGVMAGPLGCIAITALCMWLIYKFDVFLWENMDTIVTLIVVTGSVVGYYAWEGVKAVYCGLKKLVEAAVPIIVHAAKTAWSFVGNLINSGIAAINSVNGLVHQAESV